MRRALLPFCDHDTVLRNEDEPPRFGHSLNHKSPECQDPKYHPQSCLRDECWGIDFKSGHWQHKSICDHIEQYGIDAVKDYFVFTVIRNPFEKIVSAFLLEEAKETGNEESFRQIALRPHDKNIEWLYGNLDWLTRKPPSFPGTAASIDLSLVNLIAYHQKDLSSVFNFVKKRVGLPSDVSLENYHKTNLSTMKKHYSEFFSEELRDFIFKYPLMELERKIFNWEFNEI
jgi:hypothetical protein